MNECVCLQTLEGRGRARFRDSNGTQMRNQRFDEVGEVQTKRGGRRSAARLLLWPP